MSNRTYSLCPNEHKMFFDMSFVGCTLREWWCPKCEKNFKFTSKEKRMVMVAYKYGRECGKKEIKDNIKRTIGI